MQIIRCISNFDKEARGMHMSEFLITAEHDFANLRRLMYKAPEAMIYHTREYVDFVASILNSEPYYLGLKKGDKIIGAFPLIMKKNKSLGNIINSNPFFGSYGGIIVDPDLSPVEKERVKSLLLEFFKDFALTHDCVLSTIITSPFDRDQVYYLDNLDFTYRDWRVAPVTVIPPPSNKSLRERLFLERFSSSCRRAIKKAEKIGIKVRETQRKGKNLDDFYRIYLENMEAIDATVKEKSFFERALEVFPETVCALRYGELDGQIIGGLIQFYYKDIMEYFQPAVDHDYRSSGVTNLLVYSGMEQGFKNGFLYWNFGGTWRTQKNLYKFKRSFGAIDFVYHYFITAHADDSHIRELTPADLAAEYSGFYVLPYSELDQKS